MKRIILMYLASICMISISGCAASDAAREEQVNTAMQDTHKPMGAPVSNGSAIAAKMISPVTGY
jgi:hypothetical protein